MYIDSRENGLVLSVKNGSVDENAEMVLSQPESDVRQAQHQQWYLDENTGTLRTALNDYCLDIIKGESTRFQSMIDSPSAIFPFHFVAEAKHQLGTPPTRKRFCVVLFYGKYNKN